MTVETPATPGPPAFSKLATLLSGGLNAIFKLILRSPLHGLLSKSFILVSFKGRNSGKTYTIVVGYQRVGEVLEVLSPRNWWKNIRGQNTAMRVLLQGRWYNGSGQAFHRDETVTATYLRAMQRAPSLIKMYRVEVDASGQPKLESVRQATRNVGVVHIRLAGLE
ncbi:hypothetical protein EPA93_05080 [Ktedonosporobacter rubrisoli]|uniref:DUF385 domain-containing protein n=1 Tax=Ktedonosporobacter rubrisoli TaxID=2509675 RepID=A0A4P6JJV2_KTERU|nr:hypothetical protein [Ktedonosporobacter rubrisoli]QBD75408.1 hypothetical protein EPA93_05080 [Ktedonosporobacter rubrisoli]